MKDSRTRASWAGVQGLLAMAWLTAVPAACGEPSSGTDVITIVATDHAFEVPGRVNAGTRRVRFRNEGAERHQVAFVRVPSHRTALELANTLRVRDQAPDWAVHVGGIESIGPGGTGEATLILEPGRHVLVCFVGTADGRPHYTLGMIHTMEVVAGPAADHPAPEPDLIVSMYDYGYGLSGTLESGRRVIQVVNAGPQVHNMLLWKLDPGRSPSDVREYYESGRVGPSPGRDRGGVAALSPGRHAFFRGEFEPGSYAIFCLVKDLGDGRLHLAHGMARALEVREPPGDEASRSGPRL